MSITIMQEIAQLENDARVSGLEAVVGHKFREITIKKNGAVVVTGNFFKCRDWMNGYMEASK